MSEPVRVRRLPRIAQVLVTAIVALAPAVLVPQSPAGAAIAESGVTARKQIDRCDRRVERPFLGDTGSHGSMIAVEAKIRCYGNAFITDGPNDKIIVYLYEDDNAGPTVYLGQDEVDLSGYWYQIRATAHARDYCRRTGSFKYFFAVAYFKYHWWANGERHRYEATIRGQGTAIQC